MFSSAKSVERGKCSCCKEPKDQNRKLFILDVRDVNGISIKWEPKLIESDVDYAACLKCWSFVGYYLVNRIKITGFV